jgi:hypothetical protein
MVCTNKPSREQCLIVSFFLGVMKVLVLCWCAILCVSCGSAKVQPRIADSAQSSQSAKTSPGVQQTMSDIPPNHSAIVGRIVSISSRRLNQPAPCINAPCMAIVRIESLRGVGMNFPDDIIAGEDYTIVFSCTLAPTTKEIFPDIPVQYPGLQVGARFTALLRYEPGFGTGARNFSISHYEKL